MRICRSNKISTLELLTALFLWIVLVTTTTMLSTNAFTKVGASTENTNDSDNASDNASDNDNEEPVCSEGASSSNRDPPRILTKGSFRDLEDLAPFRAVTTLSYDSLLDGQHRGMQRSDGDDNGDGTSGNPVTHIASIPGGEAIGLRYVRDLVSEETAAALIGSCDKRSGWTTSPQSVDGKSTVRTATRTSRSCPLIWPQLYLPLLEDDSYRDRIEASGLRDEIDLTWRLTQRVASLLGVGEEFVEPFQLVRYLPGEFYKEHHDHGSYYGVDTEQRPLTLLVFLSDLPSRNNNDNSGGYTKFRSVGDVDSGGVSVVPRMGDGVLWKNENSDGNLLMEAVHEAVPPGDQEGIVKYAMNVWIAKKKIKDNMDVSAYRTQ